MADDQFSIEAIVFVIILLIYILTSHFVQIKNVPILHESTVAIIMGFLSGVLARYAFNITFQFSSEFFFTIILPPIIFAAGYSLRKSLFFENFSMIGYLGIVGTIIGFILISTTLYTINSLIFHILELKEVLMLSAIFCATDTIAANNLIKAEKFPILNAVLFSEGIINDAVAIILFNTVSGLDLGPDGGFTFGTFVEMVLNFCYLLVFSLLLGLVSGFGISYLLKINESFLRYPIKQTSLILLNGYISYLIGELLGLSGIITLFTCAIVMGHYAFMNVSEQSQRGTGLAFQTVGYLAQAFVFAYLGASIVSVQANWLAFGQAMMLFAFLPLIRAIMVYLLPGIYALMKKPFPLNSKQLKICWFSGMVRGAIAFALSLQIDSTNNNAIDIIAITIALITTIGGSSTLKKFAECIGFGENEQQNENNDPNRYNNMIDEKISTGYHKEGLGFESEEPNSGNEGENGYSRIQKLKELQSKYIKPIFQRKTENLTIELSESLSSKEEKKDL